MSAVCFKNFSFGYDYKETLTDISLTINEGDYLSIIGPNGSGKSTLLKSINRIVKGGRGDIELFGKNLHRYSQKELGQLIGYVPQSREQTFPYTIYEFVMMGRYPYFKHLSKPDIRDQEAVEEALKLTNLTSLKARKVAHLSGGERQKVYLAGALAQHPKILLLDEPTTHLDPKHQIELLQTILEISSKLNITVLHVTHDLNHIFYWSKKIMALKNGAVVFTGSPQDILTSENLSQIFDAKFLFMNHPKTQQKMIIPEIEK